MHQHGGERHFNTPRYILCGSCSRQDDRFPGCCQKSVRQHVSNAAEVHLLINGHELVHVHEFIFDQNGVGLPVNIDYLLDITR